MRILLVEDEKRLATALKQLLKDNQIVADMAYDGETGLDLAMTDSYDAIILDIMLPKINGIDVLKQLRKAKKMVPILLLTARDTVDDRVSGLDAGADDYLVKPFANKELLARLRALTRRPGTLAVMEEIVIGSYSIDMTTRIAQLAGEPLTLTTKEFQLLELFLRNCGKVLSKEIILDRIWGPDAEIVGNAVENYVHFLRKKIEGKGHPSHIETVRGVGYILRTPELNA